MPVLEKNIEHEGRDPEKDREREKGPSSKSKAKDLSHVPCKFFKVGSCTAGASCPFSHTASEPGQQKGVCAWFVKGNCKFGHKCALAHILPGQSMSMDRKNKKAAQVAAGGAKPAKGSSAKSSQNGGPAQGNGAPRSNSLLSGSTAPTRILPNSGRAPMPVSLKATISPSAPAPPLQDTDFGLPDETNKLPSAPAQTKQSSTDEPALEPPQPKAEEPTSPSPAPLPFSTPSAPRRTSVPVAADPGVIGSPTRSISSSHEQPARINGFSPGTSPAANPGLLSTSPFSAPGPQSVFFSYDEAENRKGRSGIAASLGATRTIWRGENVQDGLARETVVEDEDLEEFVPGSLSDLLTPEERSRRYSRTHAANPVASREDWTVRPSPETHHHRYSRSVPAPSLLGDINVGALGSGTPSSFKSTSAFGGRSLVDEHITSFLSPSNASAAFLPGTHSHYLSKAQRTGNPRPGAYTPTPAQPPVASSVNAANLLARLTDPPPAPSARQYDGSAESFGARRDHLPQGLAAGYSRIHALPPPPVIPSPTSGAFGFQPGSLQGAGGGSFSDWIGMSPGPPGIAGAHGHNSSGFDAMVPRMSYSGAATRPPLSQGPASRTPSGKGQWTHGTPLSPLSGPVVTGDDDDLFVLDG
ncbi:hypothetical protein FA95DRAFT_1554726 [Auriscalpium vulgare]|uniref:Uncharacterized protein n=1 Tax=Auriscalpium vulgare TaxID=40419 RepID=A0ACB8S644_9AGAM|nr:hypothetical protein FA95DRAFT_1554726 [Auriscalpium vulgare]